MANTAKEVALGSSKSVVHLVNWFIYKDTPQLWLCKDHKWSERLIRPMKTHKDIEQAYNYLHRKRVLNIHHSNIQDSLDPPVESLSKTQECTYNLIKTEMPRVIQFCIATNCPPSRPDCSLKCFIPPCLGNRLSGYAGVKVVAKQGGFHLYFSMHSGRAEARCWEREGKMKYGEGYLVKFGEFEVFFLRGGREGSVTRPAWGAEPISRPTVRGRWTLCRENGFGKGLRDKMVGVGDENSSSFLWIDYVDRPRSVALGMVVLHRDLTTAGFIGFETHTTRVHLDRSEEFRKLKIGWTC